VAAEKKDADGNVSSEAEGSIEFPEVSSDSDSVDVRRSGVTATTLISSFMIFSS
jgi:hypothetical protein